MRHNFNDIIVIALGGSIICPDEIDTDFVARFDAFVREFTKQGKKLVIVVGGGKTARRYQEAAVEVSGITDEDKDWLGIHATRINAHFMRTIFRDIADPVMIDAHGKMEMPTHPVTVGGGWRPGWSTDYVSTVLANDFGAKEVVIAGKPDGVYDDDPSANGDAQKFESLSWSEYRDIIPAEWSPGSHTPVDTVAAKFADEHGLTAIVVNGKDLDNLGELFAGNEFTGTTIR